MKIFSNYQMKNVKIKKFTILYMALTIHNLYKKIEREKFDIKTNFIMLYFNNILTKLMKYQKFFLILLFILLQL